jgi:apolipoprotein N-acyltransferase
MSASRFFRYLGTGLLSALLLIVSFPFTGGLTWMIFIAWVPLLWVASELRETKRGWLWLLLIAYISFLLFNIGTTWWIWNSTAMGALLAFGCNSLLMALTLTLGFIWFKKKSLFFFLLGTSISSGKYLGLG